MAHYFPTAFFFDGIASHTHMHTHTTDKKCSTSLTICASPRASHDQTSHMRLTQNDTRNRMNVGPNANSKEKFIKSTKNRRHGGVSEAVLTTSQRPRGRPVPGVSDASDASDPPLAPSWPPSSSDGDQSSEQYAPSTSLSRANPTGSSSATEVPVDPCDIFSVNNTLSDHTPRPQDCHPHWFLASGLFISMVF